MSRAFLPAVSGEARTGRGADEDVLRAAISQRRMLRRADGKWHAVGNRSGEVAMNLVTAVALLAFLASSARQTPVEARKLVCFGNEASWSVRFDGPGQARVILPSVPLADCRGRETRNEPLKESVWRGNAQGTSGTGHSGCNTVRATDSTQGNRITIGAAAATRKMCSGALMGQERDFLKALESATRWTVDGGRLDMHHADDERALTALPSEAR